MLLLQTFCVAELLEKTKKNGVLSILVNSYQVIQYIHVCNNLLLYFKGIDTDQNLTLKQRSELVALDALLTDKLRPAVVC